MTQDLQVCLQAMFTDSLYKLVLSKCRDKPCELTKVEAAPYRSGWQFTQHRGTQVYHQNVSSKEEAIALCCEYLRERFLQANAWDGGHEYILMVSKAEKISFIRKANSAQPPAPRPEHDRKKRYIIEEGTVVQPLIDMGILTVDGRVIKSQYGKFRQSLS